MPIKVKVEPDFNWEECVIRVDFRDVNPQILEGFEKLVNAWFKVGNMGGYSDIDHAYTNINNIEPGEAGEMNYLGKFHWDGKEVSFYTDLGTAGDVSINILFNMCAWFNNHNLKPIRRIWVGYPGPSGTE
ncbi:MAG: DUF3531 family protein [Promethearchaeota archaeon]